MHHCMRLIGHCVRAIELLKERVSAKKVDSALHFTHLQIQLDRRAKSKRLVEFQSVRLELAEARIALEQARLLVLKTSHSQSAG